MNFSRDQFLARPAFTFNEDGGLRVGDLREEINNSLKRLAPDYELFSSPGLTLALKLFFEFLNLAEITIGFDDPDQVIRFISEKIGAEAYRNLPTIFVLNDRFVIFDFLSVLNGTLEDTIVSGADIALH
ncbi:MAG: hypothetical protein Q7O66_12590 [Dehalococcoidia bacterium]|nr:hypothetical protein [Dehalococcoidia bacterium]